MTHKPPPQHAESTPITLTVANWSEHQQELYAIRYQVFVLEQKVPEELEQDEQDPLSQHLLARTSKGQAIGTGRLLTDGHIGRIAVLPDWRQYGIGRRLMEGLIELARQRDHQTVRLNAQVSAHDFYAKLGFQNEGEPFWEAGILHQSMYRLL